MIDRLDWYELRARRKLKEYKEYLKTEDSFLDEGKKEELQREIREIVEKAVKIKDNIDRGILEYPEEIDIRMEIAKDLKLDYIGAICDGVERVRKDDKWFFINKEGRGVGY